MNAEDTGVGSYAFWANDTIRYCDTDRQGHVNNVAFTAYLETGRVKMLLDNQMPLPEGAAIVIARLCLDFKAELNWPGTVMIGTSVSSIGRSSFKIEQGIYQNGRLAASAESVVVLMDEATRKSRPLTPELIERLSALMRPAGQTAGQ